ncbi:MAG: hypothetical protein ABIQ80_22870 [Fibrobacteria bacterium]
MEVESCPLIVAGESVFRKDIEYLQAMGQSGIHGLIRKDSSRVIGEFQFQNSFAGFTSGLIPEMVSTATPGVMTRVEDRGIVLSKEGELDTLYPGRDAKPFMVAPPETTLQACADRLRKSDVVGLASEAFVPGIDCRFELTEYWIWDNDKNGHVLLKKGTSPIQVEHLLAIGRQKGFSESFWAKFETSIGRVWMFSSTNRTSLFVAPKIEYPPQVTRVGMGHFDNDSLTDFVVETLHYYGDGNYSELSVIMSSGIKQSPSLDVLPLSGSSGEESGQTVKGIWWIERADSNSILFIVRQEEEGKEFKAEAYTYGKNGFGPVRPLKVVFGLSLSAPMPEDSAKIELARLKLLTRSDLHILPNEATRLWFVGKLFLDERERSKWVAGLPDKERLKPMEFALKPARKPE